jgi:hypothetical protein
MKNITVILPVHFWNEEYEIMFQNAVSSVEQFYNDVKLSIVTTKKVADNIKNVSDKLEYTIIHNGGETDFCSQINLGIEKCDTEWFTILEIDDEFRPIWLKSMMSYSEQNPEYDVFLPIVRDINTEGKFLSFTNEAPWAYGFSEKMGELDNEALLEYQNFQTSGALYRTEVIKKNGSFKENIKLTFSYEFLLRLTHNDVKIFTVPKIGYQHVNFRENSLFWSYKNAEEGQLSTDEARFWLDTAKKEFFFKNKREITYVAS